MKIRISKQMRPEEIEPYLAPVKAYCQEKLRKGMYDDWNEAEHTVAWLEAVAESIRNGGEETLDIYYLEEDGKVIGTVFALLDSNVTRQTFVKSGILIRNRHIVHLTCIHILEAYRGKGRGRNWLTGEIFDDLRKEGVERAYGQSVNYRAFPLYESIGKKVATYLELSDHQLYQRIGYIYQIDL